MSNITEEANSASTETFVTALVFNAAVFGIEIVAFTLLRPYFRSIYEPRTYVPPNQKRIPSITSTFWAWPIAIFRADYRDIKLKNGLDAYFFVRFLRMMVKILFPIWIISWAVLMPVTSVNTSREGNKGLDRFTFGNIGLGDQERYAAHIILVYFFTGWIFYVLRTEMRHFVVTRQAHLISPAHSKSLQATSILITGIPPRYLSENGLRAIFKHLPGKVLTVWINRNLKDLPDVYDRREAACNKLEAAETKLIKLANEIRAKAAKKGDKQQAIEADAEGDQTLAARLVPEKDRPTHRLGFLPFTGEKVDTIKWARDEINACNKILDEGRGVIAKDTLTTQDLDFDPDAAAKREKNALQEAQHIAGKATKIGGTVAGTAKSAISKLPVIGSDGEEKSYPAFNSAFVQFDTQIAAHMAAQSLTHHEPYRMVDKYIEVAPQDIIWRNLNMTAYERKIRTAISYALTAGLIITWAFPVAFVGAISNITLLCAQYSWLNWLCGLPPPINGIISGILPPVALAILMMLLPIVLRLFASFEGIPSRTGVEMSLMTRYFIFQVIHSFLIVTLSSGIIAALDSIIKNPTQVPGLLAQNLPRASTFFLTYVVLQGLSGTAGGFLQIVPLAIYYVKLVLLGSTARSVYNIKYTLRSVAWGTLFPSITLLTTIALGYQIISPIINGLACFTFILFFFLYKYLFLYVYGFGTGQGGGATDTGGLFFPKAIGHIFVGLYVQQVCLAALFFLSRDENNKASAIPQGALMVVLIVFTAGFQFILTQSFGPLITALPLSLADKTYRANGEESPHDSAHGSDKHGGDIETVDRDDKARLTQKNGDETSAEDEKYGFLHPAASRPQRTIWLPRDPLGLGEAEEKECLNAGVDASTDYAVLNEKRKVDVSGAPPDLVIGRREVEAEDV